MEKKKVSYLHSCNF